MPTPKQMLIIEHLVTSPPHKSSASFLTKDQAADRYREMHGRYGRASVTTHTFTIDDKRYYFFSNDHCFGYVNEKNKLQTVPCTATIPMNVSPRAELPNGIVGSVDDYIKIFHDDEILIDDFMQLVELIDQHNLLTTDKF